MSIFKIGDFRFVKTCDVCPEQYDVYHVDDLKTIVGYIRLRHGMFSVECPDCGGNTVFEAEVEDWGDGCFIDEEVRTAFLMLAKLYIEKWCRERVDVEE